MEPRLVDSSKTQTRIWIWAIFGVALVPLFTTPVYPLIDFYNHIARYSVLARLNDSAVLQQNYASHWAMLPNIGLDIVGWLLFHVFSTHVVAALIILVIFLTQYWGVIYLNSRLTGRPSVVVAIISASLLYSYILAWGFSNFLLGLGLVFWGAGIWLQFRNRPALAIPISCVFALVIFFVHGVAFALYGLLVASLEASELEIKDWVRPTKVLRTFIPVLVQSIAPALIFALSATGHAQGGATNAFASAAQYAANGHLADRLLALFEYRLGTILRVEDGPSLVFDAVTLALQTGLVMVLLWSGRMRIVTNLILGILGAAGLVVFTPPALFGVGYVSDRMPLFLALLLASSLEARRAPDKSEAVVVLALMSLLAVRLGAVGLEWSRYRSDFDQFNKVASMIPKGSLISSLTVGASRPNSSTPRCEMYGPLLIADHDQIGNLFANETQQPIRLVGGLRDAVEKTPPSDGRDRNTDQWREQYLRALGPAGFDYLLACNWASAGAIDSFGGALIARTPRFELFRLRP